MGRPLPRGGHKDLQIDVFRRTELEGLGPEGAETLREAAVQVGHPAAAQAIFREAVGLTLGQGLAAEPDGTRAAASVRRLTNR